MIATRVPQAQQGLNILKKCTGDLPVLVNELDIEVPTAEDSGSVVCEKTEKAYSEFLGQENQYAGRFEALLYEKW